MEAINCKLRTLPAVEKVVVGLRSQPDLKLLPQPLFVAVARKVLAQKKQDIIEGNSADTSLVAVVKDCSEKIRQLLKPGLRKVINGTGIVLHTNLGRAPLGKRAVRHVNEIMAGYSTLEFNVETGGRGSRYGHVAQKLCAMTGAEDVVVVNNNAAGILLAFSSIAAGREVIVSRGQLVEIGGSFRIPDVLRQSGVRLVEVGATNKTHLSDYADAITEQTAAILKVHTSNYRIIGFTGQPDEKELAELARQNGLAFIHDIGSGLLAPLEKAGLPEPTITAALAGGANIVTCSGDKLLGGAQAGIIAGETKYLEQMKKHPLLRAVRIDKLSLAALEGTIIDYLCGNREGVEVQRMLALTEAELYNKAESLLALLRGMEEWLQFSLVPVSSQAGGGALPEVDMASWGVCIKAAGCNAAALEQKLRNWPVPIVARIHNEEVIIDVRCLNETDMAVIREACSVIGRESRQ